jgi:hypothetical protein
MSSQSKSYDEYRFQSHLEAAVRSNVISVANSWMFDPYIKPTDNVLYQGWTYKLTSNGVLKSLNFSDLSARFSTSDMPTFPDLKGLKDLDVVISCHALEHTLSPLEELHTIRDTLKDGGILVLVVPCEGYKNRYVETNVDQHLYTWSPLNIGNLVHKAGFKIISCERICHLIPPKGSIILKYLGPKLFHLTCRLYGYLASSLTQVRVVAQKL